MCRSIFRAGKTPLQWTVEIISQILHVQSVIILSQQSFATRIFIQIYFIQIVIPALILRCMTVFAPNPVSLVFPSQIESNLDCGKFSSVCGVFKLWEIQFPLNLHEVLIWHFSTFFLSQTFIISRNSARVLQ